MAEKTASVGFRWRPEIKLALDKAAKSEDRSASWLAEKICAEWLRTQGWLKEPKKRP